jgi:two-component system sensor histidine kinase RegB
VRLRTPTTVELRKDRAWYATARMALDLGPTITLPWLVRLRWSFVIGQLVVLSIASWAFGVAIDRGVVGVELGLMAVTNLALRFVQQHGRQPSARLIGAVLIFDTGLLTLLLAGSGGSANPFTVLYLVQITLSAVLLGTGWTFLIAALSLAGFALLFATGGDPGAHMHGGQGFDRHLQAMWAAFALAAGLIAFFVGKVTYAIAAQREQIARLRETNERTGRLAAVTRLAAGAAHELGSPLATIAVAAHEAKLHAAHAAGGAAVVDDLELIMLEVDRCQDILHRMAARGSQADELESLTTGELGDRIRDLLGEALAQRIDLRPDHEAGALDLPGEQLADAVVALIKNALDASAPADLVVVTMARGAADLRITVEDRGVGIPDDVLGRVGQPFFTTKEPGRGLGLGMFLVRTFLESRGGTLDIQSAPDRGTRATIHLPLAPT